jgi:hypothetical protein
MKCAARYDSHKIIKILKKKDRQSKEYDYFASTHAQFMGALIFLVYPLLQPLGMVHAASLSALGRSSRIDASMPGKIAMRRDCLEVVSDLLSSSG